MMQSRIQVAHGKMTQSGEASDGSCLLSVLRFVRNGLHMMMCLNTLFFGRISCVFYSNVVLLIGPLAFEICFKSFTAFLCF